ncbi:hypothetical protein M3Y99_00056400 [Aphelenchoides fujianensis]|nr:hypothetical protein M3Y99_00056400 [Aphelenchoides fujianensis]
MSMTKVALLSFASVVGLTLLVLGCALPELGSWWPLFVLVFYFLSPLPMVIAKNIYQCDFSTPNGGLDFALFVTSGIVFSAFALPFVLAHTAAIQWSAFAFVTLASLVIFGAIIAYFYEGSGTAGCEDGRSLTFDVSAVLSITYFSLFFVTVASVVIFGCIYGFCFWLNETDNGMW